MDQHDGATTWAILSSPIAARRIFLDFFDDAYATITMHEQVNAAQIQLHFQDSRLEDGLAITLSPNNSLSCAQGLA